jgi:hypothetical protein
MKRIAWWVVVGIVLPLTMPWVQADPMVPLGPRVGVSALAVARGPRLASVTFRIRHRVFHEFRDVQTVKMNQDFLLGDTEFSARLVQYVPDFQMILPSRKVLSLSDQPRNPAFRVIVRKNKVPQDTTWAFLKSPPHFGARSYFAFQVLRIDFVDREPIVADTAAAPSPGMPHTAPAPRDSVKG